MDGGVVTIHFKADTSNLDDKTSKLTNSFGSLTGAITLGNVAAKVISKTFSELASNMDGAIKRFDTLQNFPKVMKNFGVTSEEASESVNRISDSIQDLPTSLDQAVGGVQNLFMVTKDLKEAENLFTSINDSAMVFAGGSTEAVDRFIYAFKQAMSAGKVSAQDFNQMNEAIPGLMDKVAEKMGMSYIQLKTGLSDGSIAIEDFNNALKLLDSEGVGSMEAMRKAAFDSTGGIGTALTNLKSRISRGLASLIGALDEALADYGGISGVINKTSKKIADFLTKIGEALKKVDFNKVVSVLKVVAPIILTVAGYFLSLNSAIKGFSMVTQGVTTVMSLLSSSFALPIAIIIGVIAAIVLLYTKCEWFRNMVNSIIETLKPLFKSLWDLLKPMFDSLIATIKQIWVVAEPIIKIILQVVTNMVLTTISLLTKVINVIKWVIDKFNEARAKISNATSAIREAVVGGFNKMIDKVKGIGKNIIDGLIGGVTGGAEKLYNKCKEVGKKALNKIKETLGIHSPSTEFAMVGKFSMLGFEKGLMDMQPEIDKAINSMFTLNPSLTGTMNNSMSPNINVVNNVNLETDPLGQVVNKIKTYSGGAKNDYNWGTGL
jgi:tape measure domain-containing protein